MNEATKKSLVAVVATLFVVALYGRFVTGDQIAKAYRQGFVAGAEHEHDYHNGVEFGRRLQVQNGDR